MLSTLKLIFASHSLKTMNTLLLARLLQVYQIKLPDGYKLEAEQKLIKRSYNDITCTITPRN